MLEGNADNELSIVNSYIAKPSSPQPPNDQVGRPSHQTASQATGSSSSAMSLSLTRVSPQQSDRASSEKPFVWRMHQPERKYQLFPKDKQMTLPTGKGLDPEQAFALAMGQNGEKTDKPAAGGGLRLRIKEHNLVRRRKVSVPELGPMTTVQEVAMDSRTYITPSAFGHI